MWDERYSEPGFAYGTAPNDFLVEMADKIRLGPVLCLAEGEGRNAVFLAGRGHQVLAVDQSAVGLEKARVHAEAHGVNLSTQACDLAEFEFEPGHYGAIVSIWAHTPPEIRKVVHARCVRALRPGGLMILEAYRPSQVGRGTGGPPNPAFCMTAAQLRSELDGLEFAMLVERERQVDEGKYHRGLSDVVQMLALRPE